MPIQVRNKRTGSKGRKAIEDTRSMIRNIPKKLSTEIPTNFYPNMANRVRKYFGENYIAREGWSNPSFTSKQYRDRKDDMLRSGDSFRIGSLGVRPVVHGSGDFGRRTDAIYDAVRSKAATIVRTEKVDRGNDVNIRLRVGIDPSKFQGGNTHVYRTKEGKQRRKRTTVRNQLLAFSHRVTPASAGTRSVFARLTAQQLRSLAQEIRNTYKLAVNRVFTRRTERPAVR